MHLITLYFSGLVAFSQLAHSWPWNSGSALEKRQSSDDGSCAGIGSTSYTDSSNLNYTVACGNDLQGQDIQAVNAHSYEDCFALCDNVGRCQGFAYLGGSGPGTCFLKQNLGKPTPRGNVDCGFKSAPTAGGEEPQGPPGSCEGLDSDHYMTANNTYLIDCGIDRNGGDLATAMSPDFAGCFTACDDTTDCVGFAYLPGTCYLKATLAAGTPNSYVDSAYLASGDPQQDGPGGGNCPPPPPPPPPGGPGGPPASTVTVTVTAQPSPTSPSPTTSGSPRISPSPTTSTSPTTSQYAR